MIARSTKLYHFSLMLGVVLSFAGVLAQAQTVSIDDADNGTLVTPVTPVTTVQVGPVPDAAAERFVPRDRISVIGVLEIRHDSIVTGPEVKLRQVCRWSEEHSASFLPIADLLIDKLTSKRPKKITLEALRNTLRDAGVNQGLIQFTGSTTCMVSCADTEAGTSADDGPALNQWVDQNSRKPDETPPTPTSNLPASPLAMRQPADSAIISGGDVDAAGSFHTLRDLLLADLSERLNIPIERIQMSIDGKDSNLLNLSEPTFHFTLEPRRVRDLGKVSWEVSIMTGRSTQKVTLNGEARAWEQQLVVAKPIADRQVIRQEDLAERRVLMDHVDDDPVLTRNQVINQQATRDLKPGTVMTARLIEGVPLAKIGQTITVTISEGSVQIRTAAKAMESGCYGQSIKVINDDSKEVYYVTLTGAQTGVVGSPQ